MRILAVTPFLPDPRADHGGAAYLGVLVDALAREADLSLVSFATAAELSRASRCPVRGIEVVARPLRRELGAVRNAATMLARWGLRGTPVAAAKFASSTMRAVLRRRLASARPDVCLVEMSVLAQYLDLLAPVPTILTDHEAGEPIPARIGPGGFGSARDRRLWERYVERHYPRADRIQALTEPDAGLLAARIGRPVAVRPPAVALPDRAVDPGAAPPRLVFLGDYAHHPNPEAARYLARELLPAVRAQVDDAELWLCGARAPADVARLGELPGVVYRGFVEDLAGLLGSARLLAAPMFSGGGSRIKVLTALAHGLPVVANDLGLQGIAAPPEAAPRAESKDGLAAAVVELLRSPDLARAAGSAARAWAEANVSATAVARLQLERCAELVAERHRTDN